eukprot:scaffold114445_cov36-Phaeocystis_antarctica.AAC.1
MRAAAAPSPRPRSDGARSAIHSFTVKTSNCTLTVQQHVPLMRAHTVMSTHRPPPAPIHNWSSLLTPPERSHRPPISHWTSLHTAHRTPHTAHATRHTPHRTGHRPFAPERWSLELCGVEDVH